MSDKRNITEEMRVLWPQYRSEFTERTITPATWKYLQEQAEKHLAEHADANSEVLRHWRSIRDGDVPFGYTVKP